MGTDSTVQRDNGNGHYGTVQIVKACHIVSLALSFSMSLPHTHLALTTPHHTPPHTQVTHYTHLRHGWLRELVHPHHAHVLPWDAVRAHAPHVHAPHPTHIHTSHAHIHVHVHVDRDTHHVHLHIHHWSWWGWGGVGGIQEQVGGERREGKRKVKEGRGRREEVGEER